MDQLSQFLDPIARFIDGFGIPAPIVHWGHPVMMGIVIFVMGTVAGIKGWQGRLQADPELASQSRTAHRLIVPWMYVFILLGSTGGILSLVMQGQSIIESPHFWTGTLAILLLGGNAVLSLSGFWGDQASLRTTHAYLGSLALGVLVIHTIFGVQLGLSF